MSVPTNVVNLVEQFQDQLQAVKSPQYKEAWVRVNYIDPFFKALGWDVHQENSGALINKEVVHEDSLRVEGAMKAPDYCFYTGGTRKFFVEAKKPSVNLFDGRAAAFQVRRYAWSAKLPLSVLTDFEELAIYDCRVRPQKEDKASTARSLYMTYEEYPDRWDEIASLFSKEAVLAGSLDAYTQDLKKKRGIATVDQEFLKEMEGWREILAKDLAKRNPSLTRRELNYAVQMTIDRIVFLRICEDRGIEDYGNLEDLLGKDNVYGKLCGAFRDADDKYNSGLFHFREEKGRDELPDDLTLKLQLADQPLKKIIKGLYYPESPYQFSVMPVEIMGQVYEQFLGRVISVAPDHRVVIEEKPEVRKAGGVYYTPSYIVDYIVENTVGKLLEGKTPRQVSKLKILDPACGSGSFLIGAYTYLLEWHRRWYVNDGPNKHAKVLYEGPSGEWQLTTAEKKRILLDNVYGVDIDPQAVEVTKLSLLLKVLEGETNESINSQLTFFNERTLPDLDNNIKCGNSLIGPDFYNNDQMMLLDEDTHYQINVFDWNTSFPQVFESNNPGFDAVIGNPPWISLSGKFGVSTYARAEIDYLINRFQGNTYMPNMYEYFIAQGLNLLRDGGYFSLIVPDRFGFNSQFIGLRNRMLRETRIISLLYKVPFPHVIVDTMIFVVSKHEQREDETVYISEYGTGGIQRSQKDILTHPANTFEYVKNLDLLRLTTKLESLSQIEPVASLCKSTSGFGGKSQLITRERISPKQIPTLKGNSIGRYERRNGYWFEFKKENITGRTTNPMKLKASPKILLRKTGNRIIATYDNSGVFPEQSLYFLYDKLTSMDFKFILGVLNSKLLNTFFTTKSLTNRESIAQVKKTDLDRLPIRTIDFSDPTDEAHHDLMVELVQRMLSLHEKLQAARMSQEKTFIQNQINATDHQINQLVYELYGLSEDEIKIIEG